jgi:hypothetical protein
MDISISRGDQASSSKGTTEQQQCLGIAAQQTFQVAFVTKPAVLGKELNNNSIFA